MILRIVRISDTDYRIQSRFLFFWWLYIAGEASNPKTTMTFATYQEAHDAALAAMRERGIVLCKSIRPTLIVVETLKQA